MNVLVTGSQGFLGRHFVAALRRDGHMVLEWDIRGYPCVDATLGFQNGIRDSVDLVLHCAAVSPHRAAIDERPLAVGVGNLKLDAAMFRWAALTRPGRVVYFSSSAVYPTDLQNDLARPRALREDDCRVDRLNMGDPDAIYGWVKLTGERLARAYRELGGAVTVVRPFSGYGEDQAADFPFGAFVERALRREDPFVIWGDGGQVRDFIHVDDVVAATLAAVDAGVEGPLNLCTGAGTSMRGLAGLLCERAGYRPVFEMCPGAPAGVAYRVGDPTRMRDLHVPAVDLAEGVRRALAGSSTERVRYG